MLLKTTVVIPNYNGKKYLEDCLKSLNEQDMTLKVIIVDNASSDSSIEYIKNVAKTFQNLEIKLIELKSNTGFSNAVNVGIKESDTEYVFLLNNDTICEKNVVKELEYLMDKRKDAFSVQALMTSIEDESIVDDSGDFYNALGYAFTLNKGKRLKTNAHFAKIMTACAGAAIYKRNLFDEVGYFDVAHFCYLEDVDIGYRARICGYNNYVNFKAKVRHKGSATSGSKYNEFKQKLAAANNIFLIYKNMPFLQLILNLPFIIIGVVVKLLYFTKKGLGGAYAYGIIWGFKKIKKYKNHKVKFKQSHLKNYIKIQLELWGNFFKIFTKI